MQNKFTPGPWTASKQGMNPSDYDIEIRAENGEWLIATAHLQNEASEANARLLAAAPCMFAALESASETLKHGAEVADNIGFYATAFAYRNQASLFDTILTKARG